MCKFNRFDNECENCNCYYMNMDKVEIQNMDVECSLEQIKTKKRQSMFIETSYFITEAYAIRYYAKQEVDENSVKEYIKEGLVHIGKPSISSDALLNLDEDGRYWINE